MTYKDTDGNECSLLELCRKEPEWAANVIASFDRLKIYATDATHATLQVQRDVATKAWQTEVALLRRLCDAAGCPDEENGDRIVARVKGLYDAVICTHRVVTPAEGGPDMCGDCGADIEDAIDEAALCPAHGRRDTTDELLELRSVIDALSIRWQILKNASALIHRGRVAEGLDALDSVLGEPSRKDQ